ncbi:hypothetical protein FPHYL_9940 [Fusarium phyllophilum]|uniref:Uncharacterized protein n=1 Tax=Fusarium phyllophilum TaxID=47803 RepID=A0A8H5J3S4_9HYPO|nr:hypothetical protein FPHYL_9940 [Fusarium phyllophilum]
MSEQRVPDVSKIDHGDSKARELYMMAFAGAINHFDYERYQSAVKLAMGNVCATFERDGLSTVGVAYYLYKLDLALWDIYFGNLGNDKPVCPWTTRPVQNDPNDEPSHEYIDWRSERGLTDSMQSDMDVSGDALIAQEGDSQDPASLLESLNRSYRQIVDMANAATEMTNKNIEMHKSMDKLLDEKIVLQDKVFRLEGQLARAEGNSQIVRLGRAEVNFSALGHSRGF